MLQNNPTLKSHIDKLWDTFWSGGIANPMTAIEQITYLLFIKRLDDMETKRIRDAKFTGEKYSSRFEGTYIPYVANEENYTEKELKKLKEPRDKKELRWSQFKRITPTDRMLEHVRFNVFPFIKKLNGITSPFTRHMANAVFIIEKPSLLFEAIIKIEDIFKEIEKDAGAGGQAFQDIQGDVYEMLLDEIATAGKNGQFRTPRHIIKLIAELVKPKLGQRIGDPACGTGGFLLGAYQYLLTDLVVKNNPNAVKPDKDGFLRASISSMLTDELKGIVEKSLYGYDFDVTMVRLGLMNLMMHGIDEPKIDYKDTLSKSYNEDNLYDIVMANPPFTGNIDAGDKNPSLQVDTNKTELLFVSRIFNMLKIGGTAAIVVPQGVLFGSGKAFIVARKLMIEQSELKAVITLPSGVFKPYAGVATAILLFTKGGETNNVWFYQMENDGYSLDDKRNRIEKSDLIDITNKFEIRNESKSYLKSAGSKHFYVPKSIIIEKNYDLSLSKYKEQIYDEIIYKEPKIILDRLKKIELEINKELKEIEEILK